MNEYSPDTFRKNFVGIVLNSTEFRNNLTDRVLSIYYTSCMSPTQFVPITDGDKRVRTVLGPAHKGTERYLLHLFSEGSKGFDTCSIGELRRDLGSYLQKVENHNQHSKESYLIVTWGKRRLAMFMHPLLPLAMRLADPYYYKLLDQENGAFLAGNKGIGRCRN